MAETLPAVPIAFAPTVSEEHRVRRVSFGDGYEARVLDGLNTTKITTTIPYTNRTPIEKELLVDFFRRHRGISWFWWHAVGDVGPRKYVCPKWTVTRSANSPSLNPRYDISADVYLVHDLGN